LGFQQGKREFQSLKDLTHFYVGEGQPVDITFSIQREHILPTCLNRQSGLGRTSWVTRGHSQGFIQDPVMKMKLIR
jgi:predicted component of type VI protein secretion system